MHVPFVTRPFRSKLESRVGARLDPGAVVAGFRILSLLGEGAMGTVFRAEDPAGRIVALKLLPASLARDDRFRRRFLRESRIAAGLEHPHVVPVLASGEDDGTLWLTMSYVEGVDLRALLKRDGRLEPDRAVRLVSQVADALDAAHAAGLVHRDVKPGNIVVAGEPPNERAYVCDFGLARHVASVDSLTGDRAFVGTIDYVAPEQIAGKPVDGRVDVYALGCVFYELVAGERPFTRDSDLATVFAHLNEPSPRVTAVRPELPAALDDVLATVLAKSPDDRYSTGGEFVRALRKGLRGSAEGPSRSRRRIAALAAGVALTAIAAAVAAVLVTRGGGQSLPPMITPASIASAPLGLALDEYKAIFGVGWRQDVFSGPDFPVLIYYGRGLSIYFTHPGGRAVEITTWNKNFRTAAGIGPCSSIDDLRNAYGDALKASKPNTVGGKTYAYTVGHLIFGANGKPPHPATHVTAVGIYRGITLPYASYVVLNEPNCA